MPEPVKHNPGWFKPGENGNNRFAKRSDLAWANAIRRQAYKSYAGHDYTKLDKCAEQLVDMACDGNLAALSEMGNRLDGKPAQEIVQTNINGDGTQALTAGELLDILTRIARSRGFSLPSNLERIGEEETRTIQAISKADSVSSSGIDET